MKIAFVYDAVYPYRIGGVEKRIAELSRRLAERGHDVHVFGLQAWAGDACFSRDGVHVHGIGKAPEFYTSGRRSISEAVYFGRKIFIPLLRERFDIIDCQNFPYLHCMPVSFVAGIKKIPLVITWHEVWGEYWSEYLGTPGYVGKALEKLAARLSGTMVAVSEMTGNDLHALNDRADITIIPNGIDLSRIAAISPSDTVSDLLFSGRLLKEKNIDLLIRAVAIIRKENPGIRCIITGDGPEMPELQSLAKSFNLPESIRFTGFIRDHDQLIALMKSSKVFVSPSVREGFGIAALEAMACGLPVVTVDARKNAVKDLVSPGTGNVSALTPEAFARAVMDCMGRRDTMTEECVKFAGRHDWEDIADKAEAYFAAIAGSRG
jgi:glycosyltransferase involved in cell wall biosynthesis